MLSSSSTSVSSSFHPFSPLPSFLPPLLTPPPLLPHSLPLSTRSLAPFLPPLLIPPPLLLSSSSPSLLVFLFLPPSLLSSSPYLLPLLFLLFLFFLPPSLLISSPLSSSSASFYEIRLGYQIYYFIIQTAHEGNS